MRILNNAISSLFYKESSPSKLNKITICTLAISSLAIGLCGMIKLDLPSRIRSLKESIVWPLALTAGLPVAGFFLFEGSVALYQKLFPLPKIYPFSPNESEGPFSPDPELERIFDQECPKEWNHELRSFAKIVFFAKKTPLQKNDVKEFIDAYQSGVALKRKISEEFRNKKPDWQEIAIKTIRQQRFDIHHLEEARLLGSGVLTSERRHLLNSVLKTPEAKLMLLQALEIQEIYQESHVMFLHAMSQNFYSLPIILKHQAQSKTNMSFHQFKFFRPISIWDETRRIEEYSDNEDVNDCWGSGRLELLSVSACPYDRAHMASALYFLEKGANAINDSEKIMENITGLSKESVQRITSQLNIQKQAVGNLLAVFIPKNKLNQLAYRAHSRGKACRCFPIEKQNEILTRWQKGIRHTADECQKHIFEMTTQYRLFLPLLTPKNGCRIFIFTPHSKENRKAIKQIATSCIKSKL